MGNLVGTMRPVTQHVWCLVLLTAGTIIGLASVAAEERSHKYEFYHATDKEMAPYSCLSCMNVEFYHNWDVLKKIYYEPRNFTDRCLSPAKDEAGAASIGRIDCSNSVCITMLEPKYRAGQFVGNNVFRGCLRSMFKASPTVDVNLLRPRAKGPTTAGRRPVWCLSKCATDILPYSYRKQASRHKIDLCPCYGHLCNTYPDANAASPPAHRVLLLLLLYVPFIWGC